MKNEKLAVHVTNEEQWNEVRDYYTRNRYSYKAIKLDYPNDELANDSDNQYAPLDVYKSEYPEYEIIEFDEWKERVKKHYKSLAEIQESIVNMLKDITQATEEGDMTVKEFTAYKIVLEQVAEDLLAVDNLEWHKEQVERRHSGFSTEF